MSQRRPLLEGGLRFQASSFPLLQVAYFWPRKKTEKSGSGDVGRERVHAALPGGEEGALGKVARSASHAHKRESGHETTAKAQGQTQAQWTSRKQLQKLKWLTWLCKEHGSRGRAGREDTEGKSPHFRQLRWAWILKGHVFQTVEDYTAIKKSCFQRICTDMWKWSSTLWRGNCGRKTVLYNIILVLIKNYIYKVTHE